MLYCHTKHRFDLLDMEFFEQLEACGLACQEVGAFVKAFVKQRNAHRWYGATLGCALLLAQAVQ